MVPALRMVVSREPTVSTPAIFLAPSSSHTTFPSPSGIGPEWPFGGDAAARFLAKSQTSRSQLCFSVLHLYSVRCFGSSIWIQFMLDFALPPLGTRYQRSW